MVLANWCEVFLRVKVDFKSSISNRVNALVLDVGGMQVAVFNVNLQCIDSVTTASYDAVIAICCHFIFHALLLYS